MLKCITSIESNIQPILEYSGRYFYQLGQYYECLAHQPQLKYNLVTFKMPDSNIDLGTVVGLCLPSECHRDLIKQVANKFLIESKLPLEVSLVNDNVQGYAYPYEWTFYLTIIISVMLLLVTLISSLFPRKFLSLSMFSVQQSSKLFKHHPNSSLNVLNGVRSISMIWVVLGHSMSFTVAGSVNVVSSMQKNSLLQPFFLLIEGGMFAVDVFFYVGGILLVYVFVREKHNGWGKYPLAVVQRFLRFWPSYIYAILIYYAVYLHLGEGPHWGADEPMVRMCSKMWKPLFFVDNLVDNGETQCMNWGWYLQNDMQLFVISLLFLFVYAIKPVVSKIMLVLAIIASCTFTFVWTFVNQTGVITHLNDFGKWGEFNTSVYIKPWARASPYLFGVLLGMFYVEYLLIDKNRKEGDMQRETWFGKLSVQLKERRKVRVLMEWTGVVIILFLVLILRTLQTGSIWPQYALSLYQSAAKLVFVMALTLTILPSLLGCHNSIIFFTMDTRLFNFIAKISFCTYLIHLTILITWAQSRTNDRYYTIIPTFTEFCGVLVTSLACGLMMTLVIEMPFTKLQKKFVNWTKEKLNIKAREVKEIPKTKVLEAEETPTTKEFTEDDDLKESLLSES